MRCLFDEFFVFNTHFDNSGKIARIESAKLLISKVKEISKGNLSFITGDFNDLENSDSYKILTNKTDGFVNSCEISKSPHSGPNYSYGGFPFRKKKNYTIDFIFVNDPAKLNVFQHATLDDNWDGLYPSDHLPVIIETKLKN